MPQSALADARDTQPDKLALVVEGHPAGPSADGGDDTHDVDATLQKYGSDPKELAKAQLEARRKMQEATDEAAELRSQLEQERAEKAALKATREELAAWRQSLAPTETKRDDKETWEQFRVTAAERLRTGGEEAAVDLMGEMARTAEERGYERAKRDHEQAQQERQTTEQKMLAVLAEIKLRTDPDYARHAKTVETLAKRMKVKPDELWEQMKDMLSKAPPPEPDEPPGTLGAQRRRAEIDDTVKPTTDAEFKRIEGAVAAGLNIPGMKLTPEIRKMLAQRWAAEGGAK